MYNQYLCVTDFIKSWAVNKKSPTFIQDQHLALQQWETQTSMASGSCHSWVEEPRQWPVATIPIQVVLTATHPMSTMATPKLIAEPPMSNLAPAGHSRLCPAKSKPKPDPWPAAPKALQPRTKQAKAAVDGLHVPKPTNSISTLLGEDRTSAHPQRHVPPVSNLMDIDDPQPNGRRAPFCQTKANQPEEHHEDGAGVTSDADMTEGERL